MERAMQQANGPTRFPQPPGEYCPFLQRTSFGPLDPLVCRCRGRTSEVLGNSDMGPVSAAIAKQELRFFKMAAPHVLTSW